MIFELVNETLREHYIGVSLLFEMIEDIQRHYKGTFPKPIAHWVPSHDIHYRRVKSNLTAKESLAFVDAYAKTVGRKGWKVITD